VTETFLAECDVRISASPETVFAFFVDAEQMIRWQGVSAELDARPGGIFRLEVTPGWMAVGSYVKVDPPRFVSFTWGWEGDVAPVPVGGSLVEVTLEADGDETVVSLRHSGLPSEESVAAHLEGWTHYFERLAIVAPGGDPGRDPWLG
jgi:uncharacterized protein YndB with AHSA1/START domain